jgi:hypothetical protein
MQVLYEQTHASQGTLAAEDDYETPYALTPDLQQLPSKRHSRTVAKGLSALLVGAAAGAGIGFYTDIGMERSNAVSNSAINEGVQKCFVALVASHTPQVTNSLPADCNSVAARVESHSRVDGSARYSWDGNFVVQNEVSSEEVIAQDAASNQLALETGAGVFITLSAALGIVLTKRLSD